MKALLLVLAIFFTFSSAQATERYNPRTGPQKFMCIVKGKRLTNLSYGQYLMYSRKGFKCRLQPKLRKVNIKRNDCRYRKTPDCVGKPKGR